MKRTLLQTSDQRPITALLAAFAALLLGACASTGGLDSAQPAGDFPLRTVAAHFSLSGRISVTNGSENASGLIDWTHSNTHDQLAFSSPLGQLLARLDANPEGALLRTAKGETYQAANAQALLPRLFGIELPLARLPGWLQAAPASDADIRERDPQGRPALVIDQGWRIEYPAYQHELPDALPGAIRFSRGDTQLRLAIDTWTLAP